MYLEIIVVMVTIEVVTFHLILVNLCNISFILIAYFMATKLCKVPAKCNVI